MTWLSKRLFVVFASLAIISAILPTPALASHCGSGRISVSGVFTDQATGRPLTVVADVTFFGLGGPGGETKISTRTVLPTSSYSICLPTAGVSEYGVVFRAPGYERTGVDFDAFISPIPSAGAHVVLDESQARPADIFQSEMFFFREDGLYRAYDPNVDGSLPRPVVSGTTWPNSGSWMFTYFPSNFSFATGISHMLFAYGPDGSMHVQRDPVSYSMSGFDPGDTAVVGSNPGWDIVAGHDTNTVFFYRGDGNYEVRDVYQMMDGSWTSVIRLSGTGWTPGWTSIVPVDLNGDNHDELLFYRQSDGLFRYYNVKADGSVSQPILAGEGYTRGWGSISAVDLDGDGQDEIFFYRRDGLFRFYDIRADGTLPSPLQAGTEYTKGWDSITRFESCRIGGKWVCPPVF